MRTNLANKKIKKIVPIIFLFLFLFLILMPVFASAAIIPCGGTENGNPQPPCDFNMLMELVNNIIDWMIMISIPIAAGVFAWAGFTYMTTAVMDQKSYAKSMINKVFIGLVFILSAWIIVNTITNTLLTDENGFKQAVPVEGTKK